MTNERFAPAADVDLDTALRDLALALDVPAPAGIAERVRTRIELERPGRAVAPWWRRPIRRSVVLALAALLIAAAAVGAAIGYGLPGLRILFGPVPSPAAPAPSPSGAAGAPGAPGALLALGTPLTLDEASNLVDFDVLLPPDPAIGPPDAVYLAGQRLALGWGPDPALPGTAIADIGLLLIEINATVDEGMIRKIVDSGTPIEAIAVDGAPGYWISGDSHALLFVGPDGEVIPDSRRLANNTLVWTRDGVTYRLEADLGLEEALELAASLR
jgi:hypothetical protein